MDSRAEHLSSLADIVGLIVTPAASIAMNGSCLLISENEMKHYIECVLDHNSEASNQDTKVHG